MVADALFGGDDVDELAAGILGVAGHEAKVIVPRHLAEHGQQVGEVHPGFQALAVAVHVLAQQGDLFVTRLHQLAALRQNVLGAAAALSAAHIGHDAVGAEIVAAVHDGQPGPEVRIAADGHLFHDVRPLHRGLQKALFAAGELLHQQLGQGVDGVHAEHQVHKGVTLAQLVHHGGLLGHAAAQADDEPGLFLLEALQRAHIAEHPLLGVLAHGAGVEEDEVRLFRRVA